MKNRFITLLTALALVMPTGIFAVSADEPYIPVYQTDGHEAELDVPETIDVDITAKESQVVRTTEERQLLGMSLEWGTSNTGFMESEASTEFNKQFLDLAPQIKAMHSTRTAGASLTTYHWKNCVGPMSKRKTAGEGWYFAGGPLNYGPAEWIKQFQLINPDCDFIVGLNVSSDTPENLADYAEYFLGDETTTYGKMRIDDGIKDPVKVGAFELGNEVDYIYGEKPEQYGRVCEKVILAIRERFPEAKFIMCGKTYPLELGLEDMSWRSWIIKNMEIIGKYVDYMSFHAYYDGQTMAYTEIYLNQMQKDIKSVVGEDKKIRFAFTEAAVWPRDNGYGDPPLESQTQMLTGVLSTADFLSRCFKRDDTWASSYYAWGTGLTGDWGVLGAGDKEQKWYTSGILQLYNLYDKMLGEKVLYSFAKSDNKYAIHEHPSSKYSALVTQNGDNELMLILTNKTAAKKFNTTFNFEHKYKLVEETVFTAPDMESKVRGKETADIFTTTVTPKDEPDFTSYVAPEKSLVFLRLERTDKSAAPSGDEVAFEGEKQFDDINGFWGKNEVSTLSEQGLLNGVEAGRFAPYDNITRAQFAQMLSNALLTESGEHTRLFNDVADDAWYAQAVYNVYKAGFMRGDAGGSFRPDDEITLEELVMTAVRAAKYYNPDISASQGGELLEHFKYGSEISPWAKDAVAFAAGSGLLSKLYENGYFKPSDKALRGQAAVIIYRINSMK